MLRNVKGTATPYQVPTALMFLKLPCAALTAVLGFIPLQPAGLFELTAFKAYPIAAPLALAAIPGYSQQIFTSLVDQQGQNVLNSVKGPLNALGQRPATATGT